ncbi:MAG: parallel beta-helix domain-containing protein [Deltaproteobacteria bacterium]|nr:parallel beta-helix domain-containing protein [Deltaproteobacteria bacterium]
MKNEAKNKILLLAGVFLGVLALVAPAAALAGDVIVVETTIQAAVDSASPGDTIVVPPGVYKESVLVTTSGLTIQGSHGAIIDAEGFENGITVAGGAITPGPGGFPICPTPGIDGFTVQGLTVKNADENGVFVIGVNNYHITGGKYIDNEEYGIFPICSTNGLIDFNQVEGTEDAGIYVGDDDTVLVTKNHVTRCTIGIEVENTLNADVINNKAIGNTTGILVVVLPGLPIPKTENVKIVNNVVNKNNFPNPVPPPGPGGGEAEGALPTGTGILNVGGDNVLIKDNVVNGNDSLGVAIIANPFAVFDPRIEPFPDNNRVESNVILQNGSSPDPLRATTPGADIVYDASGTGNCFTGNIFMVDFPAGITGFFPCP